MSCVSYVTYSNQQDNTCLEIPVGEVLEQLELVENIEDYSTPIQQPLDGDTITRKCHMDDDFYDYQYICGDPERCIHEGKIYGEKAGFKCIAKDPTNSISAETCNNLLER